MEEESQPVEIICPWCYSLITIDNEEDSPICNNCKRRITEEDIAESLNSIEN